MFLFLVTCNRSRNTYSSTSSGMAGPVVLGIDRDGSFHPALRPNRLLRDTIMAIANGMEATLVRASAPYLYLVARAVLARTCLGAAATHGYVIGTEDLPGLSWPVRRATRA